MDVLPAQDRPAVVVDDLALLIHDVVVLEKVFPNVEVVSLDLFLRVLNGASDHPVLDRDALLHAKLPHEVRDPIRGEDAHQVILKREEES